MTVVVRGVSILLFVLHTDSAVVLLHVDSAIFCMLTALLLRYFKPTVLP